MSLHTIKWLKTDNLGRKREAPVIFEVKGGRIVFVKSDFCFKDQIKAMRGSKYHGFDDENPRRIWSVEDCHRNWMTIQFLAGQNIYEHFDQELQHFEYARPLMNHQCDMSDAGLTYHYQIWGAEMGLGKTLSAQEVIERSGHLEWWWIGPKTSLPNIQREFRRWDFPFGSINVEFMTYERLVRRMDEWKPGDPIPPGLVCDESSKLKNWGSQRTQAAAKLADLIRKEYGFDGYVILMTGTPSPKSPVDWWAQAEVAYPGFLAEGSDKAFRRRLSFMKLHQFSESATAVYKVEGWRDDERKCHECGEFEDHPDHQGDLCEDPDDFHAFKPSVNEVALLPRRLKGLVVIKHKKDCLDLPDKRYRRVYCKPNASTLRVAQALATSSANAVIAMTLLRELSDGFQYREVQDGTTHCTHCEGGKVAEWTDPKNPEKMYRAIDLVNPEIVARLQKTEVSCPACNGTQQMPRRVRQTREVPCPKDQALKTLLEENEEHGRVVIFAGFTGSVDRCVRLCQEEGWHVVRCDGRGFHVTTHQNEVITGVEPLDYWADLSTPRVAFVAHPESGGMSLTLTEARMAVYWSNTWKPEYRVQSEDRLHRIGTDMNLGVQIVDLIHLPSDERVLEVIRANRRLELMSMGELDIDWNNPKGVEGEFLSVAV
jgi:SNF2 family DNA or RNA helicase